MSEKLLVYTRLPINNVLYDPRLAYSMHLALFDVRKNEYEALNHNSGVLFVLGTENEDGSINPMSIQNPYIFTMMDGKFGIAAIRISGDGGDDESSKGCVVLFESEDLVQYKEKGLLKLDENYVDYVSIARIGANNVFASDAKDGYQIVFKNRYGIVKCVDTAGFDFGMAVDAEEISSNKEQLSSHKKELSANIKELSANARVLSEAEKMAFDAKINDTKTALAKRAAGIEGAVVCQEIEISDEVADRLRKKLLTPENIKNEFPSEVTVSSLEELKKLKALSYYSDGTMEKKNVDWNLDGVDFTKAGKTAITGKIHKPHFEFPVAFNRADPCVFRWEGKYYFIATNDADDNHTLFIRQADTLEGLVDAEEILLLDSNTYEGIGGLLWAPEFHEIEGRLYIFHAATPGEFFFEESHIMALREGGNPACREDWSAPRRIVKKDGSDLCEAGKTISLDMTCFKWEGEYYVAWSQRQFLPKDLGAWLYIAKLDKDEPWKLATDPVVLSKPDYGWANNHTFVDEGPFALESDGKLYITYSSAAVDTSYVVSYLVIESGKNLFERTNWRKSNYPILTARSVPGEFGTGHNAYVYDEEGYVWNTYHARPGVEGVRSSGIRRVHFDSDGCPRLDVTEELDVKEEISEVKTILNVIV